MGNVNAGLILIAVGTACSVIALLRGAIPRFAPEYRLIERGLWDECDGEPMNKWAEEFDRRDAALAPANSEKP